MKTRRNRLDPRSSLQVHLAFDSDATGWAYLTLSAGRSTHQIKCSWLCDTLGDLIRSLTKTTAVGKDQIHATDESHEDVLITVRRVGEFLELIAKKRLVAARRENWRTLGRYRGKRLSVCSEIALAYRKAIEPLGPKGYYKVWGHSLPLDEFNAFVRTCVEKEKPVAS
ncbi:MAG TPA: hypothetical protein VJZ71_19540 [Phycisphaerae bacterium]|nr:hypothetical protein [Phycisphaerae bacterium]